MPKLRLACVLLLSAFCSTHIHSQSPPARQFYRALSVVAAQDLEQALNRHAVEGYRLVSVSSNSKGTITAILGSVAGSGKSYQYRALFGAWAQVPLGGSGQALLDMMNEAGSLGFRFVPRSVALASRVSTSVVLEKVTGTTARYEYRIFSPAFATEGRFDKNALEGVKEGFRVVFHASTGRGPSTLMERQTGAEASLTAAPESNLFLNAAPKDADKKMEQHAAEGYAAFQSSEYASNSPLFCYWLQKVAAAPLRTVSQMVDSKDLPADRRAGFEKFMEGINAAATEGYRLAAVPVLTVDLEHAIMPHPVLRVKAAMLLDPGAPKAVYRFVEGDTLPELLGRVNAAAGEGFRVIPGSLLEDGAVFMQKEEGQAK